MSKARIPQSRASVHRLGLLGLSCVLAVLAALVAACAWMLSAKEPAAPARVAASAPGVVGRVARDAPSEAGTEPATSADDGRDASGDLSSPADVVVFGPAPARPRSGAASDLGGDASTIAVSPTATRDAAGYRPAPLLAEKPETRDGPGVERGASFGGTPATRSAVDLGLAWLAAHQDADGAWSRTEFMKHCPRSDSCTGPALNRAGVSLDAGLTGLCLLAFLGAGHSAADSPYRAVADGAVAALLRMQQPDGGFSVEPKMAGYNNALGAFALSEYAAATGDATLRPAIARAAARIASSQQRLGGWDYLAHAEAGRNDTSITGWMIQALHSCEAAGVRTDHAVLIRALLHLRRATGEDGRVWYADAGTGFQIDRETTEPAYRYGSAMVGVGVMGQMLLGVRPDDALVQRQRALLLSEPPSVGLLQGRDPTQLHDYYYWYYGTVAMFQLGGASWERWNAAFRDAVLTVQERGKRVGASESHATGSWPPYGLNWGKWGRMGGRVYTTAINVLALEIYYRKTPAYLESPCVLSSGDWRDFLARSEGAERRAAVRELARQRVEIGEPVLVELLADRDAETARTAAIALAECGSPMGAQVLRREIAGAAPLDRVALERALAAIRGRPAPIAGHVRRVDESRRLATVELRQSYHGLRAEVRRDGRAIAQVRVLQRFTGSDVAIIEVERQTDAPRAGDAVAPLP